MVSQSVIVDDTIAAIATPPGPAARGVIRLSGPQTAHCLASVLSDFELPSDSRRGGWSWEDRLKLDEENAVSCQLLFWPDERSYTRQPSAEIHLIGASPLLEWALETLCRHGARLARPGEFTLRAFLSGRIDLTQAEAVLGILDAREEAELATALRQAAGGLADPLQQTRQALIHLLAELEAGLDFVEEDIEFITAEQLLDALAGIQRQLFKVLDQIDCRNVAVQAIQVVLEGRPNAGKSQLFNALSGEEAIVSDQAGTTRDYLETDVEWSGLPIRLIDTAGLDEPTEPTPPVDRLTEQMQGQTSARVAEADIRVYCIDSTRSLDDSELARLAAPRPNQIFVLTKIDQPPEPPGVASLATLSGLVETSSRTGAGLDRLRDVIVERALSRQHRESSVIRATATRAQDSLRAAVDHVNEAIRLARQNAGEEWVAAELRLALDSLGQVVGAVHTDDILDVVFGQFCIGK